MATATKYVTRKEFEPVKVGLEKLSIRAEVISFDLHRLTNQVADVAEDLGALHDVMEARFDVMEARFEALEARFDKLEARFDVMEARFDVIEARFDKLEARLDAADQTQAAILSAVMQLLPR